ncbi:MAG: VCBS repeat-containing protein [Marinoscillum sp.]
MAGIKKIVKNIPPYSLRYTLLNKNSYFYPFLLGLLLTYSGCQDKSGERIFKILDVNETGIEFNNTLTSNDQQNILDYLYFYNGGGVAIGDINNDSLPDIYFTSNQGSNRLYLNKGNMKFEDITETAGVAGNSDWNTGTAMADVNGDGLLDIYVCAVVGIHEFTGENELFINNGDATFTNKAAEYGLNYQTYGTAANFFDYDLDGDLDLYLLNHAIHTPNTFGKADLRFERNAQSGDKLLRNDEGVFKDISEEAGILGGVNSYGLSTSISDFNADGYPDIYVCNDFYEDDYYYLNNGNGTFTESLKGYFGHVSQFSMGSDASDINGDGFPDLMTLDMLPFNEKVLKTSGGDFNPQNQKNRIEKLGYHHQFSRNMLQVNNQAKHFSEVALLSGVAATDWSWSILFADYNQDGYQDIFISNGIPRRPNDLDYVNFISDSRIDKLLKASNAIDEKVTNYMPDGAVPNCFFQGNNQLQFSDKSGKWCDQKPGYSNGAAYGDLDNDGDLDLVTNNINELATIYENQTNKSSSYIKVRLQYISGNNLGIGTKVFLYNGNTVQFKELFPQRGFQSSSEPILHFGLGQAEIIDSIRVIWPSGKIKTVKGIDVNQTLLLKHTRNDTIIETNLNIQAKRIQFKEVSEKLGIHFTHKENEFIDFNSQKLIPFQVSDRSAALAVGDLNHDGLEDIYLGNAHGSPGAIYLQQAGAFKKADYHQLNAEKHYEDVTAIIADFDTNGTNELLVGSGGGQAGKSDVMLLQNRLYETKSGSLQQLEWLNNTQNTSVIKSCDFDQDGDEDIFIGNSSAPNDYGRVSPSYLMKNEKGKLIVFKTFENLGIVIDAVWTDFNNDGQTDLIVVGEWMSPVFLENDHGNLFDNSNNYLEMKLGGLWRSIFPYDFDSDGDVDYLLGNWGKNTKFKASENYPLVMYYDDFDNNKTSETIIAYAKDREYYTVEGLDMLNQELVSLTKKKFRRYQDFAGKTLEQVFDKNLLERAVKFEVHTLSSGVLINQDKGFVFEEFAESLQVAPINTFARIHDTENIEYVVCGGNYFGVSPYHGRFDGFSGAVFHGKEILIGSDVGLNFFNKSITQIKSIQVDGRQILLAFVNNDRVQAYEVETR